ncbi:MAG: putative Ig domain-containing protein [Acidobacteriia bacterium]|nr:putative Ig domain-containing protein [Terriglobia bacterium]
MTGTASDEFGVTQVVIEADGRMRGIASGASTWSFSLDTTTLSTGAHMLTARAFDKSGNEGTFSIRVNVRPSQPVITSPATASARVGAAFSYTITATGSPASFNAAGLPAGLTVNTATGNISGAPLAAGVFSVALSATNSAGTGTSVLTLTVAPASPVITSPATATATVGTAFSYTITATNNPASFNAAGLPVGLTVNTATGAISGTPLAASVYSVTLSATNSGGTGISLLTLTVAASPPARPVITSPATAAAMLGASFFYTITATNSPNSFNAAGLPPGLTINTAAGTISGAPLAAGVFSVTLSATNSGGTGTSLLTLTVTGTPPPSGRTAFVTSISVADASAGNTMPNWVGMKIQVGGTPVVVTSLGRIYISGNAGTHILKLVDAATGADLPNAVATVTMAAPASSSFVYADLPAPATLNAGQAYYVVTQESPGGDSLYEATATVQTTSAATVIGPVSYRRSWSVTAAPSCTYGPVDFKYQTQTTPSRPVITSPPTATAVVGSSFSYTITATNNPTSFGAIGLPAGLTFNTATGAISGAPQAAGVFSIGLSATNAAGSGSSVLSLSVTSTPPPSGRTPFVTSMSVAGASLSNSLPNWTGMQIQVGAAPVAVTSLGRIYVPGNTGIHTLKLVDATTGADVPNGSVNVTMAAPASSSFVYADLPAPATLSAGRVYYVVSQEWSGGDTVYDGTATVQTTGAATVLGPVSYRRDWAPTTAPNRTYGPVDFKYQ